MANATDLKHRPPFVPVLRPRPPVKISRQGPERPFVIAVSIDENGSYVVPECFPALPAEELEQMLADVNATNNFATFVSRARRGFVAMAEAGL